MIFFSMVDCKWVVCQLQTVTVKVIFADVKELHTLGKVLVNTHLSIQQIPEFQIMVQRATNDFSAVKC